jgi:HAE1 family hydrophobic/amphiphilic exporter-1
MAAFAPLLFMGGLLGKYMAEIPKSVLFALAASIAFDHIIIPVIASKYMKPSVKKQNKKHRFTMLYIRLIDSSSHNKLKVMLLTVIIFSVGIYLFNSLPKELFPASDAGVVNIEIKLSPVSSIESTDKICTRIEKGILEKYLKLGIIKNYISITGGFDSAGANPDVSFERRAKILIEMVEPEKRRGFRSTTLQNIIRDFVSNIAGTDIEVNVPNAGVGVGEPVNLLIKGDDIRVLKSIAKEIKRLIRKKVRGIINLKDNYGTGLPGVSISINREASGIHGFSVKDIASVLSTYYNGFEVTKYYMGDKELKVRIKIGRKNAGDIRDIDKIYIYKASTDKMIHLKELVNVKMKGISGLIARDNLEKAISITSKVEGRSSVDVMADVVKVLKGFPLPNGYTISFAGESEEMDEGFRNLSFAFIGGLVLMYIIIVLQLKSFLQPVSILITIILSIPGVAFGLLISGSKVGFMAFFGIVALAGVVVNDAIVLVTTINSYRERGMSRDEAIKTASKSRIRPILLTTFTTIAGLVPLAFAFGGEFSRHWVPMSWAIIGGLLFATFQTLIAVPVVYSLLEDMKIFLKSKAVLIISFFRKGP